MSRNTSRCSSDPLEQRFGLRPVTHCPAGVMLLPRAHGRGRVGFGGSRAASGSQRGAPARIDGTLVIHLGGGWRRDIDGGAARSMW